MEHTIEQYFRNGDAIALFTVEGEYRPLYCLVPDDQPVERLDLAGCLEETLHVILEKEEANGHSKSDAEEAVWAVMGARKREEKEEDEDSLIDIDLGYVLPGPILSFQVQKHHPERSEQMNTGWNTEETHRYVSWLNNDPYAYSEEQRQIHRAETVGDLIDFLTDFVDVAKSVGFSDLDPHEIDFEQIARSHLYDAGRLPEEESWQGRWSYPNRHTICDLF